MTVERTRLSITVAIAAMLGVLAGAAAAEQACPNGPLATPKAAADGQCAARIGHTLYEKKGSLQETLLEIRHRYAAWLAEQPQARQAVTFDPWLATPPLPRAEVQKHVRAADGIDAAVKLADGRPLWSPQKDLTDGKAVKFLAGSADTVSCLARTIRCQQAVRLTVGIGGGDRLE